MTATIEGRSIYTGYIRIENRKQFKADIPKYHPDDPRYAHFWSIELKRAVEGMWGEMFGGYRYMTGPSYHYMNYFVIQITERNKETKFVKPDFDDLEWEIGYYIAAARGFSGFLRDEHYTSLYWVRDMSFLSHTEIEQLMKEHPSALNSKGELKEYTDPLEYLRKLHAKPMGRALYENETHNVIIMGSRGGGKSYRIVGEVEHALLYDGATHYNDQFLSDQLVAEVTVGASDTSKSSEFLTKLEISMQAKADPKKSSSIGLGVYGKVGDLDYTPSFLYRQFSGSLKPNNKDNPFAYTYKINIAGKWQDQGTETKLYHVSYSEKKQDGAQAASGSRSLLSVVEEFGLATNCEQINRSNKSILAREGVRFGTEIYIGTSGNLLRVVAAKKMMLNPQDYDVLPVPNVHGTEGKEGKTGFFLPFYMTLRQYKDENGNTDFEAAARHVERIRLKAAKSSDSDALRTEKMNRPCWIEEMWLSLEGKLMPYEELSERERKLLTNNYYESLMTPVKLIWDSTSPNGVRYELDPEGDPFIDFPVNLAKRKRPNGCVVMYDPPKYINGVIPNDMYMFIGHDPYVEEDLNGGGSIASTYIVMNPKYASEGFGGNTIVASYNDKPDGGLEDYYETQEKLLALYGNPPQGLNYEKNRGADCRAHYIAKNKTYLLRPSPQHAQGSNIYQSNITSYGYVVGNRIAKLQMAKTISKWLLEETELLEDGVKRNVERLPDLFLVRQLMAYTLDGNFDAVDGFRGAILALYDHQVREESAASNREVRSSSMSFYRDLAKKRINNATRRLR